MTQKKKGNILIVDDQPELLMAYDRIISNQGYKTFTAGTGDEAMQIIQNENISLVLLDVILPDTHGFDLLRLIKSDASNESSFIVLISSKVKTPEKQSEGLETGADGFIIKPIDNRELAARIDAFMKHKNTIDELRISEERFRKISDRNIDGILIIDNNGIIRFSNPASKELFFNNRQLLQGYEFGLPIVQGDKTEIQVSYQNKFNRIVELRVTNIIWDNEDMHLVSIRDITERKRFEDDIQKKCKEANELNRKYAEVNEQLIKKIEEINNYNKQLKKAKSKIEESEIKYREIVESIKDGFVVLEGEKLIIKLFNKVASEIFGKKEKSIVSKPFFEVFPEFKETEFELNINKAFHFKQFTHFETFYEHKPYKNWYDVRIFSNDDIISIFFQVTSERKEMEQELINAKNKAEESDKLKSAFLANMSHEIRTPLNAILGFSNLLDTKDLNDSKKSEFINIIQNSGNQLLRIITDIIDISKIEAGQIDVEPEWFDIVPVLSECVQKYQMFDTVINKNIEIRLSNPSLVKECFIYNDSSRFVQIIDNLISNAVKFTSNGYIEIGFNIIRETKDGKILFYVKDNGIGIAKDQQELIFERFRQAENNLDHDGTGLGLSIIKGVITVMDGEIWLKSDVGEGTTFFFSLPYKEQDYTPLYINEKGKLEETPDLSEFKLLYAEDEITSALYLEEILKSTKIKVFATTNGKELLEMYDKHNPDLILLDIKMPVMNGFQVIKEIRKRNTEIPVIAQTAYALNQEKISILNSGFDAYLSKPVNQSELIYRLNQFLKQS